MRERNYGVLWRPDLRKRVLAAALWAGITAIWMGLCLFLSWQTGEGTGRLSLALARLLLRGLRLVGLRPEEAAFHMQLRKLAHFGVFFVSGVLFCGTVEAILRIKPLGGWFRAGAGLIVSAMALFADVPKVWIPGRHLTWSESFLNATGALAGYLLMLLLAYLARKKRGTPDYEQKTAD